MDENGGRTWKCRGGASENVGKWRRMWENERTRRLNREGRGGKCLVGGEEGKTGRRTGDRQRGSKEVKENEEKERPCVCVWCVCWVKQKVKGESWAHVSQNRAKRWTVSAAFTVCALFAHVYVCVVFCCTCPACVRVCVCLWVCVLIATVREPLSDGQLIGHLTSTEEAARKLAKRASGFNLIPNSPLSWCCPLDNSLSRGNGTKIRKNRIQSRGEILP